MYLVNDDVAFAKLRSLTNQVKPIVWKMQLNSWMIDYCKFILKNA